MSFLAELSGIYAAVGSGLVAGLCFAFSSFILRAFDKLEPAQAIHAMQLINQTILRTSAMAVWFSTVIVGFIAAAVAEARAIALAAAVLYALGAILVTGRGNVPLNNALDRLDPMSPQAAESWRSYRVEWGRWNVLRTILCALSCAGFAWAA